MMFLVCWREGTEGCGGGAWGWEGEGVLLGGILYIYIYCCF